MTDNLIIETISLIIGIAGSSFGLVKYEENKRIKRQEIIFPLIKEFEESEKFKNAKLILDNFILDPTDPNYPNRKHWVKQKQDNEGKWRFIYGM